MLSSPGSSLRWQVPHCSYQCLTRRPEALACSFLSVCLTLWDSNGACISTDSHCAFSIFVSLSHSLSMFTFLFLWVCPSLCICVCTGLHAYAQLLYVSMSLHTWNLGDWFLASGFTCILASWRCECFILEPHFQQHSSLPMWSHLSVHLYALGRL